MTSIQMEEVVQETNSKAIREQHASTIWWKGGLFRDFENFSFLHWEIRRQTGKMCCSVDLRRIPTNRLRHNFNVLTVFFSE
jgi:hypothetical protein